MTFICSISSIEVFSEVFPISEKISDIIYANKGIVTPLPILPKVPKMTYK